MKFAIIGKGFIYPRHIQAIKHIGGEIVDQISLKDGENAWKDMIKKTEADCVVVLTPNDLHYPMCKLALDSGKIVLCEKPITINAKDCIDLQDYKNIFVVLQLRHHPLAKELKEKIKPNQKYEIEMDISVYRDQVYYDSWKGQTERSGGVLFNLGSHYFDMLLYLFGDVKKIHSVKTNDKTGLGVLEGENYVCRFKVSTDEPQTSQRRVFKINGVDYNFSSQDNLSYEDLHKFVYKDLLEGKGVSPLEALNSIELIENIYKSSN
ncbi:Gfo/Idh/MocA family oxidoreductase [Candidatus Parcubacteria bacterium]|nr:Gfo/Idh/MocA family oxidoreductase [Candidatus Parcubacteria bacterium]